MIRGTEKMRMLELLGTPPALVVRTIFDPFTIMGFEMRAKLWVPLVAGGLAGMGHLMFTPAMAQHSDHRLEATSLYVHNELEKMTSNPDYTSPHQELLEELLSGRISIADFELAMRLDRHYQNQVQEQAIAMAELYEKGRTGEGSKAIPEMIALTQQKISEMQLLLAKAEESGTLPEVLALRHGIQTLKELLEIWKKANVGT